MKSGHDYKCELCGKTKTCRIRGCQQDCTKWCGRCIREKAYRDKLARRRA